MEEHKKVQEAAWILLCLKKENEHTLKKNYYPKIPIKNRPSYSNEMYEVASILLSLKYQNEATFMVKNH